MPKQLGSYNEKTKENVEKLKKYEAVSIASKELSVENGSEYLKELKESIGADAFKDIETFEKVREEYSSGNINYEVRGKKFTSPSKVTSLSGNKISKVSYPTMSSMPEIYRFTRNSNLPGYFPYSSGIFPSKRTDEDPKRMFAGEGGLQEQTRGFTTYQVIVRRRDFQRLSIQLLYMERTQTLVPISLVKSARQG